MTEIEVTTDSMIPGERMPFDYEGCIKCTALYGWNGTVNSEIFSFTYYCDCSTIDNNSQIKYWYFMKCCIHIILTIVKMGVLTLRNLSCHNFGNNDT